MPQRATLSFSVSNPLGAADLLLHGQSKLHGWGQQTFVDPTLMYVRGFDNVAQRFRYEVNPRFGSANPQFNAFRNPVTLTMQVRVDVGRCMSDGGEGADQAGIAGLEVVDP